MRHFTVKQLHDYLQQEASPLLLDVREPWEYEICHLDGSTLIPMGSLHQRLDELDREQEIVVICHHGVRSLQVCYYLASAGFSNLINLSGGIDAWANELDPDMATY
ncbi:MAG: sulfurtransferase [Gammaproteobacteria bacterium]|nr:sulfurtransferase [Gammaproteobacteria bacterium]